MERREQKQKRCQDYEAEVAGDLWDHTAGTADSKRVVSLVVGKHIHEQTQALDFSTAQFGFHGVDETRWSQKDSTLSGHLLGSAPAMNY